MEDINHRTIICLLECLTKVRNLWYDLSLAWVLQNHVVEVNLPGCLILLDHFPCESWISKPMLRYSLLKCPRLCALGFQDLFHAEKQHGYGWQATESSGWFRACVNNGTLVLCFCTMKVQLLLAAMSLDLSIFKYSYSGPWLGPMLENMLIVLG